LNKSKVIMLLIGFMFFLVITTTLLLYRLNLPIRQCIGVIHIDGEIATHSTKTLFSQTDTDSESLVKFIHKLNKRPDIKAVVFIINSPGGSVVASDEIYRSIRALNKPSVAYIEEMGTSGAYYVSLGTDEIIAHPNALTGSIGVISMFTNYEGLLHKLGIKTVIIKSAEHKDFMNPTKELNPEEKEIMQHIINQVYAQFVDLVKERRKGKINVQNLKIITDGRIFTGKDAYDLGLIDKLGTKEDAIKEANRLAGTENLEECDLTYNSNSFSLLNNVVSRTIGLYFK